MKKLLPLIALVTLAACTPSQTSLGKKAILRICDSAPMARLLVSQAQRDGDLPRVKLLLDMLDRHCPAIRVMLEQPEQLE